MQLVFLLIFHFKETIGIGFNLIGNNAPDQIIAIKERKIIFFFASSQTHFFNGKFYNQIDMGFSLTLVLATLLWIITKLNG